MNPTTAVKSKMFPILMGVGNEEVATARAEALIGVARSQGIDPAAYLASAYYTEDGTVGTSAHLIAARIERSKTHRFRPVIRSPFRVLLEFLARDEYAMDSWATRCAGACGLLETRRSDRPELCRGCRGPVTVTDIDAGWRWAGDADWTLERARAAGVVEGDAWKDPLTCLWVRALSEGARHHCAALFGGAVYAEGEVPASDAEPTPPAPRSLAAAMGVVDDVDALFGPATDSADEPGPWLMTHELPSTPSKSLSTDQVQGAVAEIVRAGRPLAASDTVEWKGDRYLRFLFTTGLKVAWYFSHRATKAAGGAERWIKSDEWPDVPGPVAPTQPAKPAPLPDTGVSFEEPTKATPDSPARGAAPSNGVGPHPTTPHAPGNVPGAPSTVGAGTAPAPATGPSASDAGPGLPAAPSDGVKGAASEPPGAETASAPGVPPASTSLTDLVRLAGGMSLGSEGVARLEAEAAFTLDAWSKPRDGGYTLTTASGGPKVEVGPKLTEVLASKGFKVRAREGDHSGKRDILDASGTVVLERVTAGEVWDWLRQADTLNDPADLYDPHPESIAEGDAKAAAVKAGACPRCLRESFDGKECSRCGYPGADSRDADSWPTVLVKCSTCGKSKAPFGRDVAAAEAGSYCDADCKGYLTEPLPHGTPAHWLTPKAPDACGACFEVLPPDGVCMSPECAARRAKASAPSVNAALRESTQAAPSVIASPAQERKERAARWSKCPGKSVTVKTKVEPCTECGELIDAGAYRQGLDEPRKDLGGVRAFKRRSNKPVGRAHAACVDALNRGEDPKAEESAPVAQGASA